ncbi:MAG: M23 family metallopeptidase [Clostridia bacterium]|nr:M23 family metallopeptidase [Clostridia bacterium]
MNHFKRIAMHIRTTIKFIVLVIISAFLIVTAVAVFYKPTYAVYFNDELIGYTENKSELQAKINQYMEGGSKDGVAFAQIDSMPEYALCLLKKDIISNDDEIYATVTQNGTEYYRYYAITDDKEEKLYVKTFEEAEKVVSQLKEKNSVNKNDIGIVEKYDTQIKEFASVETCISKLYEAPKPKVTYVASTSSGYVSGMSSQKVNIGISLIRPISGVITSRFGSRESIRSYGHRGLDIAAPAGTPIKAAASGTVTTSGYNSSYGNMIIISHGNGVQTVYGHCSQLLVSVGQTVSQGQVIGKVGSTGHSTGPHLHLEVRINGVLQNPQNYVY